VTDAAQDGERMKFTGHERDLAGVGGGGGDDLDYMHARHYSPRMGRFLSVDPVQSGVLKESTSWNKFVYSFNNPLRYIDPNGETVTFPKSMRETVERGFNRSTEFRRIVTRLDNDKRVDIRVKSTRAARTGTFAESGLTRSYIPGKTIEDVSGNVLIPLAGSKSPEVIGHELFHAEEFLDFPAIPFKDLANQRDDIWPSVRNGFETQGAIDAENLIGQQLGMSNTGNRYVINWTCDRKQCRIDSVTNLGEILPSP
jgi:RHS repeat-associated protein